MRPMPSIAKRLVAVTVTVLSLLIVLVLVMELTGAPRSIGAEPSSSPSVSVVPSPSANGSPTVVPSPSGSQDVQAVFAQIQQQVEQLRGLAPAGIGPAEVIGRAQLEKELADQFEQDYPKARQDADNLTLRALGLLKPDQDVAKLQLQLLQGQVIGFYDDKQKRMAVVSEAGVNAEAKITYAHEYTHALQDHAFGLAKLGLDQQGEDDQAMARLALVEGDATYSMLLWARQHLSVQELLGVAGTPQPDMSGIPAWMLQQLLFSYNEGYTFVSALTAEAGGSFADVDAAFRDRPPASTEQVIHPQKYAANERPMELAHPDPASALGAGWKNVESTTLGEAMIGITLQALGVPASDATAAAADWGGDELTVASGPGGGFALAWRLKWDSAAAAARFASAYASAQSGLAFPSRLVSVGPQEQLVVHASSQATLDKLAAPR